MCSDTSATVGVYTGAVLTERSTSIGVGRQPAPKLASVKTAAPTVDAFDGPLMIFLSANPKIDVCLQTTPDCVVNGADTHHEGNCLTGGLSNQENQDTANFGPPGRPERSNSDSSLQLLGYFNT